MNLEAKIEQYKSLKQMKKQLEQRLEELRKDILPSLVENEPTHGVQKYVAKTISYDFNIMWELVDKDPSLGKVIPDEDAFEQAYLNGKLTDEDLRDIRIVKEVEGIRNVP